MDLRDKLRYLAEDSTREIEHNGVKFSILGIVSTSEEVLRIEDERGVIASISLKDNNIKLYSLAEILNGKTGFNCADDMLKLHAPLRRHQISETLSISMIMRDLATLVTDQSIYEAMNKKMFEIIHW